MHLTREEERMYQGEFGPLYEWALRFLAAYGDGLKADKLVKIEEAGIHWHYGMMGMIPKEAFDQFLEKGVAVPTYSTNLPDIQRPKKAFLSENTCKRQSAYEELAKKARVTLTGTCAPYLVGWVPKNGAHVATVESSLWMYINSALGARTHRESFPGIYAIAAVGKTPYVGLQTDDGRKGNLLVHVDTTLDDPADYHALGYYIGEESDCDVPVFTGISMATGVEELKGLGAALSTMGSIGLYHVQGLTPEASTLEDAFGKEKPLETIIVGRKEMRESYERLDTNGPEKINYVVLGCPHCTIKELEKIARLVRGKRVCRDVPFWVLAPRATRQLASKSGILRTIEAAGGTLLSGCWTLTMTRSTHQDGLKISSGEVLATNSAKCAHYARALYPGIDVHFGSLEDCIDAAIAGKWR